jgi:hypothetical protein
VSLQLTVGFTALPCHHQRVHGRVSAVIADTAPRRHGGGIVVEWLDSAQISKLVSRMDSRPLAVELRH